MYSKIDYRINTNITIIDYYRLEIFIPPELEMVKYLYVEITIANLSFGDVDALRRMLIYFSDSKQPADKFTYFIKIPHP